MSLNPSQKLSILKTPQSGDYEEPKIVILKPPKNRKCTDILFIALFAICLLLLVPSTIVLTMGSDINRFIYGYDRFGNVCGMKNKPIYGINCSGQDMTDKPIAQVKYHPINKCYRHREHKIFAYKCVSSCEEPNQLIFNRCYPPGDFPLDSESTYFSTTTALFHALSRTAGTIGTMILTGLLLVLTFFYCLRWITVSVIFWTNVVFHVTMSVCIAAVLWHKYLQTEDVSIAYLFLALAITAYIIAFLLFIAMVYEKFNLIFPFYKEAIKAIFKAPILLINSLLTILGLFILTVLLVFLVILVYSNQFMRNSEDPFMLEYTTSTTTLIFGLYVLFMILWIFAFGEGWQTMVTAIATSQYYFAKDKSQKPVSKSVKIAARYHLGTIVFGSLISTLLIWMKNLADYFIRKLYVQTALHGTKFCKSAPKLWRCLGINWFTTMALAGFQYIMTSGFSFIVVLVTVGTGTFMNLDNMPDCYVRLGILIGALTTLMVTFFMVQILIMAVDTVFLCYCEEQILKSNEDEYTDEPGTYLRNLKKSLRLS